MEGTREKLEALLKEGEYLTYENFSTKSAHGYPDSYTPEWVAWRTRLGNIMRDIFDEKSAPVKLLNSGNAIQLLEYGSDKFEAAKSYFLKSLKAGLDALSNDTYRELKTAKPLSTGSISHSGDTPEKIIIPASDEFEKITLSWLKHHVPLRLGLSVVAFFIAVFIGGIYVGQIRFVKEILSMTSNIEKYNGKNGKIAEAELPRKYYIELEERKTISVLDGQILITLRSITSDGSNFEIKIPDKPSIDKYVLINGRIEFEYMGNKYFLSLLSLRLANNIKGVEIELSKNKLGR